MAASSSLTLEQLIALSQEMAALARAGVPLERGLLNLGEDLPGRLGRVAKTLAQRMERGESLAQVLAAEEGAFPRVWRTVVEAGMRSGRLSLALEGLAASARRLAEMRRAISQAMFYPLLVLLLAYGVFVVFVTGVAPRIEATYDSFQISRHGLLSRLVQWGESADVWGPVLPVLIVLGALVWRRQSGRAILVDAGGSTRWLGWFPWVGKMLRSSRGAMFAEVFALLLEHDVPLDEAVLLAAETSGDRDMVRTAQEMSAAIRRGQSPATRLSGVPPILGWLATCQAEQRLLKSAARNAAESYGRQAAYQADLVRLMLPIVLTSMVAGTATLLYGLALFVPWANLLRSLN